MSSGNLRTFGAIGDLGAAAPQCQRGVSRKANAAGPGGVCDLPAVVGEGCTSEPRQGGITEMRFKFNGTVTGCLLSVEQAECGPDQYVPYEGDMPSCVSQGNELVCTFDPALANARTYRFTLTGGSAVIRGLVGDVNHSGFVNGNDRSTVVGVWTGPVHFSCATDVNNTGQTNATDRSVVVGAWTGTGTTCAPCPPSGMGQGSQSGMPGGDIGQDSAAPSSPEGSTQDAPPVVRIEILPVGGGVPVTVLEPGTSYEVHVAGAGRPIAGYTLSACNPTTSGGIASAFPASQGPWSATGLFAFADNAATGEPGCGTSDQVVDDLTPGAPMGGEAEHVCNVAAGSPGQLVLRLLAYSADETEGASYPLYGELTVAVGPMP